MSHEQERSHLVQWLESRIRAATGATGPLDHDASFLALGLESANLLEIGSELEQAFAMKLDPAVFFEQPSIRSLSRHLISSAPQPPKAERSPVERGEPIAIVGMACRVPGADTPSELWDMLLAGRIVTSATPDDRWSSEELSRLAGGGAANFGGFLQDVDGFDHGFFGLAFAEAARMDPQQRMALELSWEALEDANIPPSTLAGETVGVFVGASHSDFGQLHLQGGELSGHSGTGNALSVIANRISYAYDLRGPSMAVDTACSSSLMAVHLAVRSLRSNESALAIVGGVNVLLSPEPTAIFSRAGMMAADGRCKTFDARADGYVRGEGAGVVVLQPLSQALEAGRRIYAVIRGTCAGQDGRSNGLTAPNPAAQVEVIRGACRDAGISPDEVGYVEAHGTGTPLGDPIEARSIGQAIGAGRAAPCGIGSIKANIGHLEAAAGVAGLIKGALTLAHGEVPPLAGFSSINPQIDLAGLNLEIATARTRGEDLQYLGVSAFGFGGANCHVVLQKTAEPPPGTELDGPPSATEPQLCIVSGKDAAALARQIGRLRRHLTQAAPRPSLPELAAGLARNRDHFAWRHASIARTIDELGAELEGAAGLQEAAPPSGRVIYLFPGQGSESVGMAKDLYARFGGFRRHLNASMREMVGHVDVDVRAMLLGDEPVGPSTKLAQCAIMCFQVALVDFLRDLGVIPTGVVGHSVGEVAAAYAAGILRRKDALRLGALRASAMEAFRPTGGMLAVSLDAESLGKYPPVAEGVLEFAAINGPGQCVLSGPLSVLEALQAAMAQDRVGAAFLTREYAFHSKAVSSAAEALREALEWLRPVQGNAAFFSTSLGGEADGSALVGDYWADALVRPVRFKQVMETVAAGPPAVLIDLGPDSILQRLLHKGGAAENAGHTVLTAARRSDPVLAVLRTVGELYTRRLIGAPAALFDASVQAALPTYAWARSPELHRSRVDRGRPDAASRPFSGGGSPVALTTHQLSLAQDRWLADHKIGSQVVVPAAYFIGLFARVGRMSEGDEAVELRDVRFQHPAYVDPVDGLELRLVATSLSATRRLEVFSRSRRGTWVLHCSAEVHPPATDAVLPGSSETPSAFPVAGRELYERFTRAHMAYGKSFQVIHAAGSMQGGAAATYVAGQRWLEQGAPAPSTLDGAFQTVAVAIGNGQADANPWVPAEASRVWVAMRDGPADHALVRDVAQGDGEVSATIQVVSAGRCVCQVEGMRFREIPGATTARLGWLYAERWRPAKIVPGARSGGKWLVIGEGESARLVQLAIEANGGTVSLASPALLSSAEPDDQPGREFAEQAFDEIVVAAPALGEGPDAIGDAAIRLSRFGRLCYELAAGRGARTRRLWIVTQGAHRAAARQKTVDAWQAMFAGVGFSVAFELPDLQCIRLDLDPDGALSDTRRQAIADLFCSDKLDDQLAEREGEILTRRLTVLEDRGNRAGALSGAKTYVVAGGTGSLGLAAVEALVQRGAKRILLLARSGPSPEVSEYLAGKKARGVEIRLAACDIADSAAVARALEGVQGGSAAIGGVIHAAGELHDGALMRLDRSEVERTLRAKVSGALNLEQATADSPLEFFVTFSSAAAALGSIGQAAYIAANAFLRAFSQRRQAQGRPTLCIDWGPWAAGMATAAIASGRGAGVAGVQMFQFAEGVATLKALLEVAEANVLALPFDLAGVVHVYPSKAGIGVFQELDGLGPSSSLTVASRQVVASRREHNRPYVAPETPVQAKVVAIWARALGLDRVGLDDQFFELGGDSVFGGQVISQINQEFGISIDIDQAFQDFTVAHLARLIEDKILEKVSAMSDAEVDEYLARSGLGEPVAVD